MTYAQFVKAHYHDAAHKGMKPQEVMKAVAKLYHAQKAKGGVKTAKGGAVSAGAVSAGGMRKQTAERAKQTAKHTAEQAKQTAKQTAERAKHNRREVKGGGDIGQLLGHTLGSLLPF